MTIRTTETTITFRRPFMLNPFDERRPAGTYRVVVDEEEILGLSFVAYRRRATMLHTPALGQQNAMREVFEINSIELEMALSADMRSVPIDS